MTLFVYLNGVDVSSRLRLENGLQSVTETADGSNGAFAGLKFDDEASSLSIGALHSLVINETACSTPRLFTGYATEPRPSRGGYLNGVQRVWNADFGDLSLLLGLQAFHTSDAKRPQETGSARMSWLLATTPGSYVHDYGKISANTALYDEADYRGQFPSDVLNDISATSSLNSIWFPYWDAAHANVGLYFGSPASGISTSSLSISNVLSDINNTTVFGPDPTSELTFAVNEVYDEVFITWTGGQTFLTAHDGRLPSGIHRTLVVDTPRIGRASTALTHAQYFLDAHASPFQTLVVPIQLPSDKVNLITAGMLVSCKFSHLPGFTSPATMRVASRTINLAPNDEALYDIVLTLTNTASLPSGGGGSGGFPQQPPAALSIIQQSVGLSTRTLSVPPTDGDVLVLVASRRASAMPLTGYTDSGEGNVSQGSNDYVNAGYKTAASDSATTTSTLDTAVGWYEISPGATLTTHLSAHGSGLTNTTVGSFSVPAGGLAFAIMGLGAGGGFDAGGYNDPFSWTTPSGWTKDFAQCVFDGHPSSGIFRYANSTSAAVTLSPTWTFFDNGEGAQPWQIIVVVFGPSGTASPPTPGQIVPWTVVTVTPGSTTSTGTTAWPYATSSLLVKVDGVLISTASYTETNPATGALTLNWVIDPDEVVTVQYLGR